MIVVRNIFKLKFGESKEAVTHWKKGLAIANRAGFTNGSARLLTDVAGPFYTLVVETAHDSLADYEEGAKGLMSTKEWRDWYGGVVALTEGGYREIFTVVE